MIKKEFNEINKYMLEKNGICDWYFIDNLKSHELVFFIDKIE